MSEWFEASVTADVSPAAVAREATPSSPRRSGLDVVGDVLGSIAKGLGDAAVASSHALATKESVADRRPLPRTVSDRVARPVAILEALEGTLGGMGYRLRSSDRPVRDLSQLVVRADSAHGTSVYARVRKTHGEEARLEFDLSGFTGTTCALDRDRLLTGLRDRGFRVELLARDPHCDERGGALAKFASRFLSWAVPGTGRAQRAKKRGLLTRRGHQGGTR